MTDSTRLKSLYKRLIEDRKLSHNLYSEFFNKVAEIRKRINSENDFLLTNDKDFLKELLYDKKNGVASSGQSNLSKDNFEKLIGDEKFISALEQFIKVSDKENFKKFEEAWIGTGISRNWLRINRVAAACTLDVSTTANNSDFEKVFDWLICEEYIPEYPKKEPQDWYSKNTFLMKKIKDAFKDELEEKETDEFYLSIFVWEIYANMSNPFSLKKQVVKYGAPGTGKTYQAHQQTKRRFDIWKDEFDKDSGLTHESQIETIQFHPSFSYEDFMEGLRPVPDNKGGVQLKLQNGVFKEFCRKAGKWEIDFYHLCKEHQLDDLEWESITIEEFYNNDKSKGLPNKRWKYIFEIPDKSKLISDAVPPFFFIIDEINRAELSRVFGELMYCLEYRGVQGKIKTQYANLNDDDTGMLKTDQGYFFFIPTNIYLIGTMNTIDRSVESFDFALRRRFHWEEVKPDIDLLRYHLAEKYDDKWVPLAENLKALNKKIASEALLGPDFQIGHAYLMNLKYDKSLKVEKVRKRIWDDSIRPLLQEYLRGTGKEAELIKSFESEFGVGV